MKNFLSRRFLPILVLLFLLCLSFGGAGAAYADGEVSPAPADEAAGEPAPEPTPTPIPEYSLGKGLAVREDTEELTLAAGSFDCGALLRALPRLPALKTLTLETTDLSAAQLAALRAAMPENAILRYTVDIGGQTADGDREELSLEPGSFDFDALLRALPRLPALKTLTLEATDLSAEQLAAVRDLMAEDTALLYSLEIAGQIVPGDAEELDLSGMQAEELPEVIDKLPLLPGLRRIELKKSTGMCALDTAGVAALLKAAPEIELSYSVRVGGSWYDRDAERVDLSRLRPAQLDAALEALRLLPSLRGVELMGRGGRCPFGREEVRHILKALPEAGVHYEFELFGQTLSTLDERVEYDHVVLTDEDEAAIREALDLLPRCRYFKLDEDRFGMRDEVFASIRDDYPDVKLVWRVFIAGVNMLTDEEILRVTFVLKDYNSAPLRYCTDAVYLDIGHNSYLSDISFLAYMPRLECLILSGSLVRDLSPLESCHNLVWVECCFCGWLNDISALRGHDTIRFVNISNTGVSDVSALEDLKLERLVAMQTRVPPEAQQRFDERNPDCLTAWIGEQPYGYPWRYDAIPAVASVFSDYYVQMRQLFLYDDKGYMNNKFSPYGPGYLALREGHNLVFGW